MGRVVMNMGNIRRVLLGAIGATLVLAPAAKAAEPNNDFATATGPLTAGPAFNASLETADDADFQFFYIPDVATVTVTVKNTTAKKNATGGRTILASVLQARKGKLPLPLADTRRVLSPQETAKIKLTLVPGKYFVPIGHASVDKGAANVPFRIQISPAGTTTDSYEIFERRCKDAFQKVTQYKSSKKQVAKRLAKAKKAGKDRKVRQLRNKLETKREKVAEAQRIKRFVCSVPQ
jgi:hypothetical protein